jgi:glucokinase
MRSPRTVLAIDIGGTKVAAGIVNGKGRILWQNRTAMSARGSAQQGLLSVFQAVEGLGENFLRSKPPCAGICVPGWVDPARGVLIGAANLPCWKNFPLARAVEKRYGIAALLSNDANAAALAEAAWGAGRGYRSSFYVTLGTGIGTGIILDGKIHTGCAGGAGEGGHITIDYQGPLCSCGKRGCIEAYASGTAIARRARARLMAEPERRSSMRDLAGGNFEGVTTELVSQAASQGDPLAREILEEAADHLAIWMGTILDLFEPEIFILGGGVGHLLAKFRARIRQQLEKWAIAPQRRRIPIVEAEFGALSALAGAAALCFAPGEPRRPASQHPRRKP